MLCPAGHGGLHITLDLTHPWEVGFLETIQLLVLFNGVRAMPCVFIECDASSKPPIITNVWMKHQDEVYA